MKSKLIFFLVLGLYSSLYSHPIIYLISPPRSLSVAFTRMMQARGDFEIFHEPSQRAYDLIYYPELTKSWFREDAPKTFAEVKELILGVAQRKPVFVKEISFAVVEFLLNDPEFVQDPDLQFVFLLRNPHHVVISFYKKQTILPAGFDQLVGYEATYRIFQFVQENAARKPLILFTEDLYNEPEKTVKFFCDEVGVPYLPHSLEWSNLGDQFSGYVEWHEIKNPEITQHWHGEAIHSSGFGKPANYEVDEAGQPTFSEVKNEAMKEECEKAYKKNLPFYEQIIKDYSLYK
jgi:hypothetical protein